MVHVNKTSIMPMMPTSALTHQQFHWLVGGTVPRSAPPPARQRSKSAAAPRMIPGNVGRRTRASSDADIFQQIFTASLAFDA